MKKIIKKSLKLEDYDFVKIASAVEKSADRVNKKLTKEELNKIKSYVETKIEEYSEEEIPVSRMHTIVECALDQVDPEIAKSYRDYRNYRKEYSEMMDNIYQASKGIHYLADKDNANTDSTLVSTQRSLLLKKLTKELYQRFELTSDERKDIREGYYYIHDIGDRSFTLNCCLFDIGNVMRGGFDMANMHYNEPSNLRSAMAVMSDIALSAAAQQYGGFTMPEIDTILVPYAEKSVKKYLQEYRDLICDFENNMTDKEKLERKALDYATKKVKRDLEQGFQEWEYKFNTLSSSRGDYPFITITFGLNQTELGKLINKTCLEVRAGGQGAEGHKRPVLFPKIVFLYNEELHGEGKPLEDIFNEAIKCSGKALYPDYLSLSGDGYVADIYKKYHRVISPMGCRAYLSPYWERGGQMAADEDDLPIYTGRWNGGAISLNLPMIFMKAKEEHRDFYEVLDEYLERIRTIHKRTWKFLANLKASVNPLAFTQGGFLYGNLKPTDRIEPLLDYVTFSFGITSLNELQELYNQQSLDKDSDFAYDVLLHINQKADEFKQKDHILYAIYGTPAESLCYTQVDQFRAKYGVVGEVGKRSYMSNSFHDPVWADVTPIKKQDDEYRFFHKMNGGHIQYCRYPNGKNLEAIKTLVRRAMAMGFYEGVNIEKNYCDDCGEQFDDGQTVCPHCGSRNITQINRVCGYIGYSKVNGDTRMNKGKMEEIKDRKSM